MRTRNNITPDYLKKLKNKILTLAKKYRDYTSHRWLHKDKFTVADLLKISGEKSYQNNLDHYYQILHALKKCYVESEHKDNQIMQNLHALLIDELSQQKECHWSQQDEETPIEIRIQLALNSLEIHTMYESCEAEQFAEKWNVPSYHLKNKSMLNSWEAMIKEQWWHIQEDHRHEIPAAVNNLLKLGKDNPPDFFILSTPDTLSQSLQDALRTLEHKQATNPDDHKLYTQKILIKRAEIQEHQVERLRKKDKNNKTPLERLENYYLQLSLWTERNLEILFMENFILSQAKQLKRTESTLADTLSTLSNDETLPALPAANKMIDDLSLAMESILESVQAAYDKIGHELKLLNDMLDDGQVNMQDIDAFQFSPPKIDPVAAANNFKKFAEEQLLAFTTSRQFELTLEHARYEQVRGIILPQAKHVIEIEEAERIHPPAAINTSDFTLIPIVDNDAAANTPRVPDHIQPDLHHNAAASPRWYQTTPGKILLGAAIGLGVACLVGGIVAAIIFSGGAAVAGMAAGLTIAAKLGTVGTASLFASIGIAGCVTGMIGSIASALHRQNTTPASLSSSGSYLQISKSLSLGNLNSHTASILLRHASSPALIQQHPACQRTHGFFTRSTKSQPLLALPSAQNQVLSSALTPNGSPR